MEESEADVRFFNRTKQNATINNEESIISERASNADARALSPPREDSLYYDMEGDKLLLIFNHYKYHKRSEGKTPAPRNGTCADVKRLKLTFERLGFKVDAYQDNTYVEIMRVIRNVTLANHENTSCVAVAILTHGHDLGYVEAADKDYSLQDIYDAFLYSHRQDLVNKPKLFFIQACRGKKSDAGRLVADGAGGDAEVVKLLPTHVDFLTMYSSVPEYISWRDTNGSWLIQGLCNAIDKYPHLDILHIITMAKNEIACQRSSNTPSDMDYHNKKQMPETRFTLTKLLKFRQN